MTRTNVLLMWRRSLAGIMVVMILIGLAALPAGASADHKWALKHSAQLTSMSHTLTSVASDLAKWVASPSNAQRYANLQATCTSLGAKDIGAVKWSVPGIKVRTDLLTLVTNEAKYVSDCLAIGVNASQAQHEASVIAIGRDQTAVIASWGRFTKDLR